MYRKEFIEQFAKKFLLDHYELKSITPDKLTEQYFKHHFKDCAIPVRKDMMPQIRQAIKRLEKEENEKRNELFKKVNNF